MLHKEDYKRKISYIRWLSLISLFIFSSTMVSMSLDVATRVDEPDVIVEPGSRFYLTIPLINPENQIDGNYAIISDAELKSSVENALMGTGFDIDWNDKRISYIIRSEGILRKSWDEQVGWFFDAIDKANLAINLIYGGPRALVESMADPVEVVTSFKGTPVDWTLDFGDKYRNSELQRNTKAIENCMRRDVDSGGGFLKKYSTGLIARTSMIDGILIPPTTDIIIQIPLRAPSSEVNHQISLNIPYYYTSSIVKVPQCAALKITPNQVTWRKTISIKKQVSTQLYWGFDKELDDWDRIGSVAPWHTMESGIKWYDQWGNAQGVIVIDACEWVENDIHAKGGIEKTILLPASAKTLMAKLVKEDHDTSIQFLLIDSNGEYVLGREFLAGKQQEQVSYDISNWAGKKVTLRISTFGAGTEISGCTTPTCCWEYIGVDWIRIA